MIVWLVQLCTTDEEDNDSAGGFPIPIGEYNGGFDRPGEPRDPIGSLGVMGLVIMLLLFTLVTGIFHTVYALRPKKYAKSVKKGHNYLRWVEYSITATIMLLIIAASSGVAALDSLVLIGVASLCCMVCGFLSERTVKTDPTVARLATLVGWLLLAGCFAVIFRRFGSIYSQARDRGVDGPPWWVWAIVVAMAALYLSFGVIHLVHMGKQGMFGGSDRGLGSAAFNERTDYAYTVCSMVSKTLLVTLLASGLWARSNADEEEEDEKEGAEDSDEKEEADNGGVEVHKKDEKEEEGEGKQGEQEELKVDDGTKSAHDCEKPKFPEHWGAPPSITTKDYVQLPGNYGYGSSTERTWITQCMHLSMHIEEMNTRGYPPEDLKWDVPRGMHVDTVVSIFKHYFYRETIQEFQKIAPGEMVTEDFVLGRLRIWYTEDMRIDPDRTVLRLG